MKNLSFQSSSIRMKSGSKTVANILRYKNTLKSIRDHVDPENKRRLSELGPKSKQNETFPPPLKGTRNTRFISTSPDYTV